MFLCLHSLRHKEGSELESSGCRCSWGWGKCTCILDTFWHLQLIIQQVACHHFFLYPALDVSSHHDVTKGLNEHHRLQAHESTS